MGNDYRQPQDARPSYDEVGEVLESAWQKLRLVGTARQPLPDFHPCPSCELRRSCAAARHCAREPRPVEQPQVPRTTTKEKR